MAQEDNSSSDSSDDFSWLDSLFKSPPPVIPPSAGLQSQYGPVGTEQLGPQQMGMPAPGGFDPVVNAGLLGLGGRPVTASRLAAMQNTLGATAGLGNADMGVAGTFAGPMARGANLAKMKLAQAMDRWGASSEMIRQQTGWDRNAANQWRYEIPDNQMAFKPGVISPIEPSPVNPDPNHVDLSWKPPPNNNVRMNETGRAMRLDDMVDHPELFKAYPDLGQIAVRPGYDMGQLGSYTPGVSGSAGKMTVNPQSPDSMLETVLHELQHGVQDKEGFAGGSSPSWFAQAKALDPSNTVLNTPYGNEPYQLYRSTSGEVEARTTTGRRTLTAEQRALRQNQPTNDVPRPEQINLIPDDSKTGTYISKGQELPNLGSRSIKVPVDEMMHPEYKEYLKQLVLSGYKAISPRGSSIVEFEK